MKIFFAKGLWMFPLYGAAFILVFLVVMAVARCCDAIERARYHDRMDRAHRYRSF